MIKEGTYDTEEKLYKGPKAGVEPEGDDPALADEFAKQHDLNDNDTIISLFTPDEKKQLLSMIKKGEFNDVEGAVLKSLMAEVLTLEQIGVFLGAASPRTKGEPMSKVATLKELNRILKHISGQAKFKFGKSVDLNNITKLRREIKAKNAEKRRQAKELAKERKRLEKEFWKAQAELNKVRRAHGLKPEYYNRAYTNQFMTGD